MTTSFFLYINGYTLNIPNTAPEFARDLVLRTLDNPGHDPTTEVKQVAVWLRNYTATQFATRFSYGRLAKIALKNGYSGDIYLIDEWF